MATESVVRRCADLSTMNGHHPAAIPVEQLLAECTVERTRRRGPGGQHRNKVETAIVLRHQPSGARAAASERRSQAENLQQAVFRLRVALALAVRRPRAAPSPLWQSRCRGGRVAVNPRHADFPALLAEALDALDAAEHDVPTAAAGLGCTASQLVKLLQLEPRALAAVNAQRRIRGQSALR